MCGQISSRTSQSTSQKQFDGTPEHGSCWCPHYHTSDVRNCSGTDRFAPTGVHSRMELLPAIQEAASCAAASPRHYPPRPLGRSSQNSMCFSVILSFIFVCTTQHKRQKSGMMRYTVMKMSRFIESITNACFSLFRTRKRFLR